MDIKQALQSLDPEADGHWTTDGLPRVDVVSAILGQEVKRGEITEAAPEFTRGMVIGSDANPSADTEPETTPDTPPVAESKPKKPRRRKTAPIADALEGKTDAERAAMVEILDDVMAMDAHDVYSDLDLMNRATAEFTRKAGILARRRDAITEELKIIGRRCALLDKAIAKVDDGTSKDLKSNQDYLRTQNEIRAKRVANATSFVKAGTTRADVAQALTGKSPLDTAIGQRNAAKRRQQASG